MYVTKLLSAASLAAAVTLALPSSVVAQDGDKRATERAPVSVRVVNSNWLDVRVYVLSRGVTYHLGTVHTGTTRKFELPRWLASPGADIQLAARPIGSRESVVTQSILFSPGDVIEWRVENNLSVSPVSVSEG